MPFNPNRTTLQLWPSVLDIRERIQINGEMISHADWSRSLVLLAEAETIFLQILAMRPNDAATLNYLGYMWADKGVQLDRARDDPRGASADPRRANQRTGPAGNR